jgi:hypothetical protein
VAITTSIATENARRTSLEIFIILIFLGSKSKGTMGSVKQG